MKIDFGKVTNLQFDGIDHKDYPDYCDAFICSADYDGKEASDEILDLINDDSQYVYDMLWEYLH